MKYKVGVVDATTAIGW